MQKRRLFQVLSLSCVIVAAFLFGSCLNPINFNAEDLPTIKVEVSGSIKIDDVAVMWLINRSTTLDVTALTINRGRAQNETGDKYPYPMNYVNKPLSGASLASYHTPTDIPFEIAIKWRDKSGNTGDINHSEVYFPKAADYKYYLYRTVNGEVVAVTEDKMIELPPDPNDTVPSDIPPMEDAHTLVVLNVTPDQDIDEVEFVKDPYTYVLTNKPSAKDQEMILLGAGSYKAKVSYTKDETQYKTNEKTAVVTAEVASMALRTNFLYFYKTVKGDYQLTQNWPPIPNDASDGNKVEESLLDTQGMLEIINNAVPNNPHALIARINIDGTEYPDDKNTTNYMGPGDPPKRYILPVGPVHVSFMPTDQTFYGQPSIREIKSKEITVLSYINDLGNPFEFPEDTGNGSGLIRIVNNSTGVAVSVDVYDKDNLAESLSIGYEGFHPPLPVQYGKVGLVPVVGTEVVPLREGANQLVQVLLETVNGIVVVERVAALKGQIVTIEIGEGNLEPNQRAGSKVTVTNTTDTPTTILGLYVYNEDNPATTALYSLDIASPPKGGNQTLYVLSTTGLPIVQGATYKARFSVYGNGNIGLVEKNFEPDGQLYSLSPDTHTRTITLTQSDLPPVLVGDFKPVTGITVAPSPYPVNSTTESDLDGSNKTLKDGGTANLNDAVTVSPVDATTRGPITWSLAGGAFNKVSLTPEGLFAVTGIADPGNDTVTVRAAIANAAGTAAAKTNFTADIEIQLTYQNTIRTVKVGRIDLATPTVERGQILDLTTLVTLDPPGANINGVPITPADITWAIVGTDSTGSNISGSTFTAGGTTGAVTIQATLPASSNDGTLVTQTTTINIRDTPPANHKNISSIALSDSSQSVRFYTKNILDGGTKKKIVYNSDGVNLSTNLRFTPSDATRQSPVTWAIVTGGAADKVFTRTASPSTIYVKRSIINPEHPGDPTLGGVAIPTNGEELKVQATVPSANYNTGIGTYVNFVSNALPVTLQEVYSNNVVDLPADFWLDTVSLEVGQSVDLRGLAHLPAGATRYVNGSIESITANDLTWGIIGSGASLSGSTLTATAAGTVTIQATLPADKNQGEALTRTATIAITAPPPPPPIHPETLTLRIIKQNDSDYVTRIVLLARPTDSYTQAIYRTGHTRDPWAHEWLYKSKDPSFKDSFYALLAYLNMPYREYLISSPNKLDTDYDWVDIEIPWSVNGSVGYNVFFVEGDSRVRGYVNKGALDPPKVNNFIFYLRPDFLYPDYRVLMGPTTGKNGNGLTQVAPGTPGARMVIPIGYDSYYNTASIMKPAGVGQKPTHDLSDY